MDDNMSETVSAFMEQHGITVELGDPVGDSPMTNGWQYRARIACAVRGTTMETDFHDSAHNRISWERAEGAEVFECLVSDAATFEGAMDIDDFAADLGFTKPSEATRAWEGCRVISQELRSLLGDEAYEVALWALDELRDEAEGED